VSVFNTRPAADFFPHSRVEQDISAYHRLMPTVLTSLGLLGTFLALLIGLHSVHVDTEHPTIRPPHRGKPGRAGGGGPAADRAAEGSAAGGEGH
jgi:hypothetical protein